MSQALCQYRGMLVVAEVLHNPDGRCPECGGGEFLGEFAEWLTCACGFAILAAHMPKPEARP